MSLKFVELSSSFRRGEVFTGGAEPLSRSKDPNPRAAESGATRDE